MTMRVSNISILLLIFQTTPRVGQDHDDYGREQIRDE